jgi:type I restriction enzyme S subunit
MKLETFFEKFDQFADAPDAVAKMRELVLQLAVQGTVVDPVDDDEPVEKFLRGIWADKSGSRTELLNVEKAQPFELPAHWRWVVLAEVAEFSIGKTPPRGDSSYWYPEDHSWVSIADMKNYGTITETKEKVSASAAQEVFRQRFAEPGSILMSFKLTIGKVARAGIRCFHNEAIISLQPPEPELSDYLFRFLPIFAKLQTSNNAIKGSTLNKGLLTLLPIALPPLAEQKRIVAKVDELMALCDRLEAQQQERETRHAALARASLARFADAPTPANLPFLFHPSNANPPPAVPNQWALGTYRSLTTLVTSGSRGWKEFYAETGSIFVRTQNIKTDKLVLDDVAFVDLPKSAEGMRAQVLKDDILITITGANVTKAARVEKQIPEAYVSQHIALTRPRWSMMSEWLHLCFISHGSARGTLEQLAYGDKPGLNLSNIRDLVLPIPPLAEQRRIVAKVEQLMALVDALETQLAASRATAANLLSALVAELTAV